MASRLPDRFDLYEACAQDPARDVRLLAAIHGGSPRILAEDFSGAGAISRSWVRSIPSGQAVCTDLDPKPLRRLRGLRRITARRGDVRDATGQADVVAALNFSICEFRARADLVGYLARARARLRRGGVCVCDIYGGADAFLTGSVTERRPLRSGVRVEYTWEQRAADPLTGLVINAMHFRLTSRGRTLGEFPDAFVYSWRLWSVPELRDAMSEAGFAVTEVYHRTEHAIDETGRAWVSPLADPGELDPAFIVLVVGRGP